MSTEIIASPPQQPQILLRPIATPKELVELHKDTTQLITEALIKGQDYGLIPGTTKDTLFKAGAERINLAFGTYGEYEELSKEIDHDREIKWEKVNKFTKVKEDMTSVGLYRYVFKCRIKKAN